MCGRESSYIRNAVILKGLRENNVETVNLAVNSTLVSISSGGYAIRYPRVLGKFLLSREDFDIIFIGFFGQPLVPLIEKICDKPIIFDAFLSAYDTLCFDRKKFSPNSIFGRFLYRLDEYSCRISDKVLLDTNAHIDYFTRTFDLDEKKFQRVFIGADDSVFYPRKMKKHSGFIAFYSSTFLPLHGAEYIIKAAKILEGREDIMFRIAGGGPTYNNIVKNARKTGLKNIDFIGWVANRELPDEIAQSDVCLCGHFSNIDKAKRVIPGKCYESMAMRKPIVVGDDVANRELFNNKNNAMFCKVADASSLADSILELRDDEGLREKIAENGYGTFRKRCTPKVIGAEIKSTMKKLIC
jgi:glycosyltransferase involved in cell wall biosynthesis